MTSMIEKVARAILFEDCGSSEGWQDNVNLAKAAIEAMREPDEAMKRAGWVSDLPFTPSMRVDRVYTAMIDAALNEGGE